MNPSPEATLQLPPQWSTLAPEVDSLYNSIFLISVVFTLGIFASMGWFMWKYRRRPGVKAKATGGSLGLQIVWIVGPLLLLTYLFHLGFGVHMQAAVAPYDAVQVQVTASQWNWEFEHLPSHVGDDANALKVPVNTPIKLIMTSSDVLHSFFVPVFRVRQDVVPGMTTSTWFEATRTTGPVTDCAQDSECDARHTCLYGTCIAQCQHDDDCSPSLGQGSFCGGNVGGAGPRLCALPIFSSEYSGAPEGSSVSRNSNHATMLADLRVISQEGYETFLRVGPPPPAECAATDPMCESDECRACWGESLHQSKGCVACHSVDGATGAGPTWQSIWMTARTFGNDAETCDADENYIRESIEQPGVRVVEGFSNVMPAYRLSDNQIGAIVAYIQTLNE